MPREIAIGAKNVTVVLGPDPTNLTLANASFGLLIKPSTTGGTGTYALEAKGQRQAVRHQVERRVWLDLSASNLLVRARNGLDTSASGGLPAIHTTGGDVTLDFLGLGSGASPVFDVEGAVSLSVANFVTLSGAFGFPEYHRWFGQLPGDGDRRQCHADRGHEYPGPHRSEYRRFGETRHEPGWDNYVRTASKRNQ